MYKKLFLVLMLAVSLSACKKSENKSACGTQICTAVFAVVNFSFTDAAGKPTEIKDVTLINVRTGKAVPATSYAATVNMVPGAIIVATDETKSAFSTEGDDIRITATSVATGKTKQVTIKVSGGCNCHVAKVSGVDTIKFD
ncbi:MULTISPECIES: hypothetical protein [unclassified Mucilaginibacter]|uniref:hypothetical protein n=1 Tax=unclassified Mucilaginibacter TaxID=2617802 RepID=UPI002AC9BD5F|nr:MULTISPECIES: hypothetical protein [unclassified Mucilaginibacter]MEB0260662.1 hypothetical protein [Mucilaginibacter sp. 10I4]MEB0277453.1 hypothetical protein [Mucilaginibacter sp. 10B2]MEB0300922.1 hypothetical protein [Mucilaginibacter sp. 5C4]WPX24917.1 hypothetical protein RHM67_06510 [Mucilaginibacter sp. 5C4]